MIDTVAIDGRQMILGWIGTIGLKNIRLSTSEVLTVTATVAIYDSAGASVLGATAMTISGAASSYNTAAYTLTTGPGGTITAAGTYRAIYTVTYSGAKPLIIEQVLTVLANPF